MNNEHGNPTGKVRQIEAHKGDELLYTLDPLFNSEYVCVCKIIHEGLQRLKLGRRFFYTYGYTEWAGNMLTNSVFVMDKDHEDIFKYLKSMTYKDDYQIWHKWQMIDGLDEWWGKWDAE
jgi:hypothetical protein